MAVVRRNYPPILTALLRRLYELIFVECDADAVLPHLQDVCERVLRGEYDTTHFVITARLGKLDKYKTKPAHVAMVERMAQTHPDRLFHAGDRVSYCLVAPLGEPGRNTAGKRKDFTQGDRAMDVQVMAAARIRPDYEHYVDHVFREPVRKLLARVCGPDAVEAAFTAALRTRPAFVFRPGASALAAALRPQPRCAVCNAATPELDGAGGLTLCAAPACAAAMPARVVAQRGRARALAIASDFVWDDCRECAAESGLGDPLLCANTGCKLFFRRSEVREAAAEAAARADRDADSVLRHAQYADVRALANGRRTRAHIALELDAPEAAPEAAPEGSAPMEM